MSETADLPDRKPDSEGHCRLGVSSGKEGLRIGLVCLRGAINIVSWRGNADSITSSLRERGHQVSRVDLDSEFWPAIYKPKQLFHRVVLRQSYSRHREPPVLRFYGEQLSKTLRSLDLDVVLTLTGMPVPYLDVDVPIVIWNDAPFDALVDFYPGFSNLSKASRRDGHSMERLAHQKATLSVYSSEWGANAAAAYGHPERLRVVPLGANILGGRPPLERPRFKDAPIELAWLGLEWHRKGGDVVLKVAAELERLGIPAKVRIAGVNPPKGTRLSKNVEIVGFISGSAKDDLLARSHFLILPSRAECTALVLAEAAAFGTPSLASRVGGIPAMIRDGFNGKTFEVGDVAAYVTFLESIIADEPAYEAFCRAARMTYESELNWSTATDRIVEVLLEAVALGALRAS